MKKKSEKDFEEYYFEGYYKGIGDFSKERDTELVNWLRGMLEYINRHYPIKNGRGKKLIEFGCATGAAANLLADYGFNVYSTDISSYAVRLAKKHYPDIKFSVHDMQKLFTRDRDFDVAVAFDVIEHLKNPEDALKNVYKILRPGGTLILTTPNDYKHMTNDPTHIASIKVPFETLDSILIYTSHSVGFSGPRLLDDRLDKVRHLKKLTNIPIEADGGINDRNILRAKDAGATRFVSTNYIWQFQKPAEKYKKLHDSLHY